MQLRKVANTPSLPPPRFQRMTRYCRKNQDAEDISIYHNTATSSSLRCGRRVHELYQHWRVWTIHGPILLEPRSVEPECLRSCASMRLLVFAILVFSLFSFFDGHACCFFNYTTTGISLTVSASQRSQLFFNAMVRDTPCTRLTLRA